MNIIINGPVHLAILRFITSSPLCISTNKTSLKDYVEEEAFTNFEGSIPIKDAAAHLFRRPYLFVNPTTHMLQIATFLAIGPQIYVDGLAVINESKKPIGRIGSKHIISNILRIGYPDWLETTAEQIMDDFAGTVDMNSPLSKAIEVFDKTRFAFVPIVAKDNGGSEAADVVASLSIRDILPLIAKTNINRSIKDLCSPLISVEFATSLLLPTLLLLEEVSFIHLPLLHIYFKIANVI